MRIGSALVRQWVYCLKENRDYSRYSRARDKSNEMISKQMEAQFDQIAELYRDWGPVNNIYFNLGSESFKDWEKTRIHLFFPPSYKVKIVADVNKYAHATGQLLLCVPIFEKKQETIDRVSQCIEGLYQAKNEGKIENPVIKDMAQPLPMPKYPLYGEITRATKGRVFKAIYAHLHTKIRLNVKSLSQTDTVVAIMQDAKNPFKWAMTDSDNAAHARGTFKKSLFNGPKVKMLVKANHDFDALVRNTIHGRFPDFS